MAELLIKQVRSPTARTRSQRDTLRTAQLGRIGKSVDARGQRRRLLRKVEHLITVEATGKGS